MARSLLAPIAPRPRRRSLALLLSLLVVAVASGCGSRRQSMRPVYLAPAPISPGCATPGCATPSGTSVESGTSTTIEPSAVEPITPASAAPLSSSPVTSTPARSALDSPPPVTGPTAPGKGGTEEPGLELSPADNSSNVPNLKNGTGSGSGAGGTARPSASSGGNNRRSPTGRLRQATLRENLRPVVNDPDGLFAPPKADRPWKFVVLHHSAAATGSYASIDREHRKRLGWDGCGYHFVIGNGSESPDGQVEVAQRWVNQKNGVHCRDGKTSDVNEYGIGICLVGDLEKSPPTDRQIASARALVAYLSDRYAIAADHTETHAHLASSPTACPGRLFPAQAILGTKGIALR